MSEGKFYTWEDLPQTPMTPEIRRRLVTGEQVMSVYFNLDKGGVVGEHQHPHEQITHVISGQLEFTVGGVTKVMNPGDVLVIPGDVPHSAVALEDTVNIEVFSPPREDFLSNETPDYMKD